MKIVIMTALAAMLMLVFPMAIKAEIVGGFDTTILPEYKGDIGYNRDSMICRLLNSLILGCQ